jgi:hypothetical protein
VQVGLTTPAFASNLRPNLTFASAGTTGRCARIGDGPAECLLTLPPGGPARRRGNRTGASPYRGGGASAALDEHVFARGCRGRPDPLGPGSRLTASTRRPGVGEPADAASSSDDLGSWFLFCLGRGLAQAFRERSCRCGREVRALDGMPGALNPNRDSRFLGASVDGYADSGRAIDPPHKPFVCHWIITTFANGRPHDLAISATLAASGRSPWPSCHAGLPADGDPGATTCSLKPVCAVPGTLPGG